MRSTVKTIILYTHTHIYIYINFTITEIKWHIKLILYICMIGLICNLILTMAEYPFVFVRILLLLFPKTDYAAQTVRPRELKLGQMVVVWLATQAQRTGPIGLTGALQRKKYNFQTILAIARKPLVKDSKDSTSLQSLGRHEPKCISEFFAL